MSLRVMYFFIDLFCLNSMVGYIVFHKCLL